MLPPKGMSTKSVAAESRGKTAISTPDGYLRFAPSWPTNIEEVDYAQMSKIIQTTEPR